MGGPLAAASKMVPVPESLMSPDCGPTTSPATIVQRNMQNCANQPQPQTPQIPKAIKTKGKTDFFILLDWRSSLGNSSGASTVVHKLRNAQE